ncbi:MAG: 1-phosphofructokinase family hexose kinase [Pseudomonadota bacterium]
MPRIITLTPNPVRDYAVDADAVEPNRKTRCRNPETHPGGGGINVARSTSRLGAETLAVFTAGGVAGEALKAAMAEENVPMRAIEVASETRIAFHVRDIAGGDEYRFSLPGKEWSGDEADQLLAAIDEETAPEDYVVGSGSLPPGAPEDFWARAARLAKKKGARFVLDSVSGRDAAIEEGFYLLRQNKFEYPALAGGELSWPDEIISFAQKLVSLEKIERVALTHGGDGSVMASRDGVARVNALQVAAHSAVGAGDSFVGGLLVGLLKGWDDEKALRYGMCAAAATRLTPGTALFDPAEVERLFQKASLG